MLKEWETYYLMIGSAAAALIGLLFVVITLTAGFDRAQTFRGARLYLTPTAVDFALIVAISAVAIAPELPLQFDAALVALTAVVGLLFAVRSWIGIRQPPPPGVDTPHWTDWWMYAVAPGVLYAGIVASAAGLWLAALWAPHVLGALVLLLLLLGIRNAWDLVTYIAPKRADLP